jgi:hypothetical protein
VQRSNQFRRGHGSEWPERPQFIGDDAGNGHASPVFDLALEVPGVVAGDREGFWHFHECELGSGELCAERGAQPLDTGFDGLLLTAEPRALGGSRLQVSHRRQEDTHLPTGRQGEADAHGE